MRYLKSRVEDVRRGFISQSKESRQSVVPWGVEMKSFRTRIKELSDMLFSLSPYMRRFESFDTRRFESFETIDLC